MQYHIEGMDCASCIGKIETALARMPGVSDVQLNFATQSLTLSLLADGATQARSRNLGIRCGRDCRCVSICPQSNCAGHVWLALLNRNADVRSRIGRAVHW